MNARKSASTATEANPLLQGIRVLDLSRLLPGPFCTQYLAQMGAEVIKIETPDGGDYARSLSPELFELVNRGKQSITLDLRKAYDVAQLKTLVKTADVLIESFRPGVMDKLGCGYSELKAINPKLVFAALTGYGQTGPYKDFAGHDMNYLATAGVLDQCGNAGQGPAQSNVQIADLAGGSLTCAVGILAAVIGAQASGQGSFVDVAMLDGSFALQAVTMATLNQYGATKARGSDMLSGALPNYSLYRCRDGKYLALGALEPKFFFNFLTGLKASAPKPLQSVIDSALSNLKPSKKSKGGSQKAAAKRKPANAGLPSNPERLQKLATPLRWALSVILRSRSRDAWVEYLHPFDACVSGILTLEEAMQNEQVKARELIEQVNGKPAFALPIKFDQPLPVAAASPALGADNAAILG